MSDSAHNASESPGERGLWQRWYVRIPVKWIAFAVVTILVLFPNPAQLFRHLSRVRNMDVMIEPDSPRLAALEAEFHARAPASRPASTSAPTSSAAERELRDVERFVLDKVGYEWDWNLWGAADYMPSVAEMFEQADQAGGRLREDCDGRAVMAASLMRRLGHDAKLVTDLRHVWVVTPEGPWMGPGGEPTVKSGAQGNKVAWTTLYANIPVSLSFGIAVFPFWREVIILVTAFALMWHRRMPRTAALIGLLFLVQGLLFLRLGYLAPSAVSRQVSSWPAWVGILHTAAGFIVLLRASRHARREGIRGTSG